jgi:hypothetical protein
VESGRKGESGSGTVDEGWAPNVVA